MMRNGCLSTIAIPEVEYYAPDALKTDGQNPNKMTKSQREALTAYIQKAGFIVPIITNMELMIADGEQRWEVTKALGMPKVPVIRLDLKDEDRRLMRQVLNKLKGEHDVVADALEFEKIIAAGGEADLKFLLGLSDGDVEQYLRRLRDDQEESFEIPLIDTVKTEIKQGDLFQLGQHSARARAILLSSPKGGVVADLFGGSGSTLIACEQTERRCYIMDIDARYCQVILDRWESYSKQKAQMIKNDQK